MRPANLLIAAYTYDLGDAVEDKTDAISHFQLAYGIASQQNDQIFNSAAVDYQAFPFDFQIAKRQFDWLMLNHHQFYVQQLLNHGWAHNDATNLPELDAAFIGQNNGLMHIGSCHEDRHVFDETSWFQLHVNYLSNHPEYINWSKNEILPFTEFSNRLILEIVKRAEPDRIFETETAVLSYFETELVRAIRNNSGEIVLLARQIAAQNGYQEDNELSSTESRANKGHPQRLIFKILKSGHMQYLSLDFENAQFEVCDERGIHQGVYNFSGKRTEDADMTGGHDLKALRR